MNKQYVATFSTFEAAVALIAQLLSETNLPIGGYYLEPSISLPNMAMASRQWSVGKLV